MWLGVGLAWGLPSPASDFTLSAMGSNDIGSNDVGSNEIGSSDGSGAFVETVPEGDSQSRMVCVDCGFIRYDNPKVVVGAVCTWEGRVLLCKRAIPPRIGSWTIPAGYLELNETTEAGALREVWEEAQATIEVDGLVGLYEIPRISQLYVIYRARMTGPGYAPGPESQVVALFEWDRIPWADLSFPSIRWGLERFRETSVQTAVHRDGA